MKKIWEQPRLESFNVEVGSLGVGGDGPMSYAS